MGKANFNTIDIIRKVQLKRACEKVVLEVFNYTPGSLPENTEIDIEFMEADFPEIQEGESKEGSVIIKFRCSAERSFEDQEEIE